MSNSLKRRLAIGLITSVVTVSAIWVTIPYAKAYTKYGDVLVTIGVEDGYCATATWPKGTTSTVCGVEQVTHHSIIPGDIFGAKIKSYSGGAVACRVRDLESDETLVTDAAYGYAEANCMLEAQ